MGAFNEPLSFHKSTPSRWLAIHHLQRWPWSETSKYQADRLRGNEEAGQSSGSDVVASCEMNTRMKRLYRRNDKISFVILRRCQPCKIGCAHETNGRHIECL